MEVSVIVMSGKGAVPSSPAHLNGTAALAVLFQITLMLFTGQCKVAQGQHAGYHGFVQSTGFIQRALGGLRLLIRFRLKTNAL
jgi:hypothetical protein